MGRGTQLFDFLTRDEIPDKIKRQHIYTSLSITDELKKFRRKWRKEHGYSGKKGTVRNTDPLFDRKK